MEIELKLLIDEQDIEKLEKLSVLEAVTVSSGMAQQLKNVYFDTPDFDLRRAGAGLRVRQIDDKYVQTLKAGGRVTGGLHQNEEWETAVAGNEPDIPALREAIGWNSTYSGLLASPTLASRLQPVFTSNVTRIIRQLRLPTGDEIEMAIDRGTIEYQQSREMICEVELELKSGVPARVYAFALQLLEHVPMRIGTLSKAARGYALRIPQDRKAVKASKLRLTPSMTVEEAFEAVVENCMQQVQGNEHGVIHGTDPESVHQMRVGLRRMRSALDLFEDALKCPDAIQDELKWLASELGAARDWEVLANSTLKQIESVVPKDVDIAKLKLEALQRARANREDAAKAVNSPRHARLQIRFAEWMTGKYWRSTLNKQAESVVDQPLKKFAKHALKRGEHRLLKRGEHLQENDPELRHRARIASKKVRYTTEFFQSLYPHERVKAFVARLSDLQHELGWLNDAAVAIDRLEQLQQADRNIADAAAFVRGYLFSLVHGDNAKLVRTWDKFKRSEAPFKH